MLALARQIVNGGEKDDETVKAVFAQARDAEDASEEYLVDDDWQAVEADPEPEVVEFYVNGNGKIVETVGRNGNGHRNDPVLRIAITVLLG